jgi:hypothetical protein
MKYRITTALLLLTMIVAACSKDDFSELRHPIVVEGEFDPVYAVPLAKMSADMATIVGMLDLNKDVSVYVGEDDIVSFRYYYNKHFTMSWVASKTSPKEWTKSDYDTIRSYTLIEGTQTFDLFEKLEIFDTNEFSINEFLVTLDADVKGYVNSAFQEVVARGANLTFDSLVIVIHCKDGYSEELPQLITTEKVSVVDLLETKNVLIFEKYNLKNVVEHRPTSVDYKVRMCITIPTEQMMPGSDFNDYMQELGVDSMMADLHACLELPLNFYSHGVTYTDTLELDLSDLHEKLDEINDGTMHGEHYTLSLNDTNCYIAFVTKNYLPVEVNLNIAFLDGNDDEILHTLFEGDRSVYAAPVVPLTGQADTWVSNGSTTSEFKVRLSLDDLNRLCDTRKVAYNILVNTARHEEATANNKPFVAIRMDDHIDIRSYVVVAAHADFSLPVNLPDIPFFK